ncbi:MAG: recombinase family protein [Nitrosomonas sp.]|nr:recombinase family protein [Nitrosomonas sp.]MCW5608900.1 recombinase family protein [Nitrosomonas sp.]
MKRLGYIRTSTGNQLIDRQVLALQEACDEIFIEEGTSAVKKHRPVYENMITQLQPGDVLVVSSLDRAFRSVLDALGELDKLHQRRVQFKSLTQDFDTTTPEGKLLYVIAAALAEWERQTISRRTKEGLKAAQERGSTLGRPAKLDENDVRKAIEILNTDPAQTITNLAAELHVCPRTLSRAMGRV